MAGAVKGAGTNPVAALERCAQAQLAFAEREASMYAAMFDPQLPMSQHPELSTAHDAAFLVLRRAAEAACNSSHAPRRPPAYMVALHVWSLTHGIATLFVGKEGDADRRLPMSSADLLEAGLLVYLQSLDIPVPGVNSAHS